MASIDVSSILSCSDIRGYDENLSRKRIIVNDKSMLYEVLTHTNAFYIGTNLESLSPGYGQIRYIPISDTDITMEYALLYLQSHTLTKIELEFIEKAVIVQNHEQLRKSFIVSCFEKQDIPLLFFEQSQ